MSEIKMCNVFHNVRVFILKWLRWKQWPHWLAGFNTMTHWSSLKPISSLFQSPLIQPFPLESGKRSTEKSDTSFRYFTLFFLILPVIESENGLGWKGLQSSSISQPPVVHRVAIHQNRLPRVCSCALRVKGSWGLSGQDQLGWQIPECWLASWLLLNVLSGLAQGLLHKLSPS